MVCFDSEEVGSIFSDSVECNISSSTTSKPGSTITEKNLRDTIKEYLTLDDTEYPYANIPRIVIETENRRAIEDRETEIPAKFQIWGEKTPESEIMELTIRGRGNSSWDAMPKHSYKIEFNKKQSLFGMPHDKDWALIANYADKTLMKNYLSYNLARSMKMGYAPRCIFIELYLNKEYQGVYLFVETIKASKGRINFSKTKASYIVEFDWKYRETDQFFFSYILGRQPFHIHYPKNASDSTKNKLIEHIQNFETFLKNASSAKIEEIKQWLDIDVFAKHFWIQEFTKNPDADYLTSVFFTWIEGEPILMGPVWDFDLAFGGHYIEQNADFIGWHTKEKYWSEKLFENNSFENEVNALWENERKTFTNILSEIDSLKSALNHAANNNFKRWKILNVDGHWISKSVKNYDEAINNLKEWIGKRTLWIDNQIHLSH